MSLGFAAKIVIYEQEEKKRKSPALIVYAIMFGCPGNERNPSIIDKDIIFENIFLALLRGPLLL